MSFALGRYFEDFREGEEIRTLARTMTETDIVNFCGVTGDFNPLHTDAEYAAASPFGERIAHGMCGFSIATGLMIRLNIMEGTIVAFFGIEDWRFRAPVKIGDTIHCVLTVVEARETSKPGRGLIILNMDVINQDDVSTMGGKLLIMMKKRETP